MYTNAADRYPVAQGGLKPKPHLLLFPGLRPAPIRGVRRDEELTLHTALLPKAGDRRPRAAAKKSGGGS
jgi:hypothetical protein